MANKSRIKIFIISITITILLLSNFMLSYAYIKKKETTNIIPSKYSEKATITLYELNLYDKINKLEYSKTIEALLEENLFQEQNLDAYLKINYQNNPEFIKAINKLLASNYTTEEINDIFMNYQDIIDILLTMKHINLNSITSAPNYNINNLKRYLEYFNNHDYDEKTAVTYVNIGLDKEGYTDYKTYTLEEASNINILVNKYHKLPKNYEPTDLVPLDYDSNYYLRKEAALAFQKLTNAALLDNVYIFPFSPYRSYETQDIIYNRYKEKDGTTLADTYSARPGFSEHQLGLAVDIRSATLTDNLTDEDYEWILNNSYKYGFIIRYPKGKSHITKYMEEPWHIRYLGTELATSVYKSKLTYDEYYDLYIEKQSSRENF